MSSVELFYEDEACIFNSLQFFRELIKIFIKKESANTQSFVNYATYFVSEYALSYSTFIVKKYQINTESEVYVQLVGELAKVKEYAFNYIQNYPIVELQSLNAVEFFLKIFKEVFETKENYENYELALMMVYFMTQIDNKDYQPRILSIFWIEKVNVYQTKLDKKELIKHWSEIYDHNKFSHPWDELKEFNNFREKLEKIIKI